MAVFVWGKQGYCADLIQHFACVKREGTGYYFNLTKIGYHKQKSDKIEKWGITNMQNNIQKKKTSIPKTSSDRFVNTHLKL